MNSKHTSRYMRVLVLVLVVFSTACRPAAKDPGAEKRPNIIFILTDDQRWDSVGFMGHKIVKTPNLDTLANDGVVFENAFVTSAICTPSRACYMLGQYERRHGVNFNSGTAMSAEAWAKSYPVLLRENGYFTGYIGKNHLPIGDKGYRTSLMDKSFDYWYASHHHIGFYPKKYHEIFDNSKEDTQAEILTEGTLAFLDPTSNEAFMGNAINFLEKRSNDKPFMLSICMNLPHGFSMERMKMKPTDDELYRTWYRDQMKTMPMPKYWVSGEDLRKNKLPNDVLLQDLRQGGYNWVADEDQTRERMVRVMQAATGIDRLVGNMRDITLKNPAAWTSAWLYCKDIVVDGITIHSRVNNNGDGIDFDGCTGVRVSNCAFDTSDDSICLQSSRKDKPCVDVVIDNCVFISKWAGIRIGLLSLGDFENVTVDNCVFKDIEDSGLKIQMCEGGTMKNMIFSNLVMSNVPRPVFMTFCQQRCCVDTPEGELQPMNTMQGFVFDGIQIDSSTCGRDSAIFVTGMPGHPIKDIVLSDIQMTTGGGGTREDAENKLKEFTLETLDGWWPEYDKLGGTVPAHGIYARHVDGLTLNNVNIKTANPDDRPAMRLVDVDNLTENNATYQ